MLIERKEIGHSLAISTTVYRKPSFFGQCLNIHSYNPISHKTAVVKTLIHGAKLSCSDLELFNVEKEKNTFSFEVQQLSRPLT